ncbi:MAG TPA: glutamine synthetase III [Bacteroidota bacterium]|nr:glutamine synthetase III [Bacteroidota bacterium]
MSKNGKLVSDFFGSNIFSLERMAQLLPPNAFHTLQNVIEKGEKLDKETANIVAVAMKDWAVTKGCTHYTHWFQPLTGFTAEKHDSFIEYAENHQVIESFSGKQLIQGEPDASSFPSGGMRSTFEARGYTIWDPTSPAFVMEYPNGNTLCIPSIFVSYTGETLDKKAPLLRSIQVLNKSALSMLQLFGNPATRVFSTLGVEQEYFLIDRKYYLARPDLRQTGRTLFGVPPAKHQQLEDQYFGNIPERAFAFMTDIEAESYKLGIPLKTRHNEVAPNQFEVAPIYEDVNVAIDHNQILMDLMDRVAARHGLAVLFHEKPFAHINGSGKHSNWALATDTGENLLNPGKTPHSNLQFLAFLVATVKAVHDHAPLLRAAIASASNDFRLGANEAPPAIISVFLGESLTNVLNDLLGGITTSATDQAWLSAGIDKIPEIRRDNTDRNRTSPFAFTGNKFEFRAVGSSQTPSTAITVLNTAMAQKLDEIRCLIETEVSSGKEFNTVVVEVLRNVLNTSKRILFEGDNYSNDWQKEAKRRGLPNIKTTPEAVEAVIAKDATKLYTDYKIFNERELEAVYHIDMENFIKQITIEAEVAIEMATTFYLPGVVRYLGELTQAVAGLKSVAGAKDSGVKSLTVLAKKISGAVTKLQGETAKLGKLLAAAEAKGDMKAKGKAFGEVKLQAEAIRDLVDELEEITAHNHWPVPHYRDMLVGL